MKRLSLKLLVLSLIPLLSFSSSAFAVGSSGFENASFSAKSLGQSNAVVAQADEPAAISYNPAGISDLPGFQAQTNLSAISIFTHYSSSIQNDLTSAGTVSLVPTGYMTINPGEILDNRITFGVGSDSPFGLANKYDSKSGIVHYAGWRNYLKMYTIKPVVSIKLTNWLSVGGGPVYYRIFDFGGIQAYPNIVGLAAGFPGSIATDGQVRINLSGNHWGWQTGLLLKPHPKHNVGFYFRGPVTIKTSGLIKVENSASGNFETGGNAKVDLPLNLTLAYAFRPNDKLTTEIDFGYTRWSAHKRLYFNSDPMNAREDFILSAIGKNDKDYSDAYSLHLGGNYKLTEKLTLLGGTLFYWAAVPKDHFIPAVPDSNSIGFSFGSNYALTRNIIIDLSYFGRVFLKRSIENNISSGLGTSLDGKYTSIAQEFSVSLTYLWNDLSSDKDIEVEPIK